MHSCAPFETDWNLHCILEFEDVFQTIPLHIDNQVFIPQVFFHLRLL